MYDYDKCFCGREETKTWTIEVKLSSPFCPGMIEQVRKILKQDQRYYIFTPGNAYQIYVKAIQKLMPTVLIDY